MSSIILIKFKTNLNNNNNESHKILPRLWVHSKQFNHRLEIRDWTIAILQFLGNLPYKIRTKIKIESPITIQNKRQLHLLNRIPVWYNSSSYKLGAIVVVDLHVSMTRSLNKSKEIRKYWRILIFKRKKIIRAYNDRTRSWCY
jgi:hypothetical protein